MNPQKPHSFARRMERPRAAAKLVKTKKELSSERTLPLQNNSKILTACETVPEFSLESYSAGYATEIEELHLAISTAHSSIAQVLCYFHCLQSDIETVKKQSNSLKFLLDVHDPRKDTRIAKVTSIQLKNSLKGTVSSLRVLQQRNQVLHTARAEAQDLQSSLELAVKSKQAFLSALVAPPAPDVGAQLAQSCQELSQHEKKLSQYTKYLSTYFA